MKPVSARDFYKTKRCYGDADIDIASLTDFYLPLVGPDAFAAYLALTREDGSTNIHQNLLSVLERSPGEFETALGKLEAVGLVRTFIQKEGDVNLFAYCLFAPLHGQEFSSDIMLAGTLKGKLGEEQYAKILKRHQGEEAILDMEEVSASFPEIFKPSFDAKFYLSTSEGQTSLGKAQAKTGFDTVQFQRDLEGFGLRKGALSSAELKDIEKIATLYSLSEKAIAELAYGCIRVNAPIGKKLDIATLSRQASQSMPFPFMRKEQGESSNIQSDSVLAQKVRLMDELPPARFLSLLQNNHAPADSDLKLVERLMMKIGLPGPCVNALIDWVLTTNDNTLPSAYCEKIAAAMVREGCRSARDAMDYLLRSRRRKKKAVDPEPTKPTYFEPQVKHQEQKADNDDNINREVTDEEVDAALADLFKD
ncbi:MAG: hypothetical protein J6A47_07875 [Bacilli bacterium]|nr:hypothetical protein [Bacilli bacterium]